MAWNGRRWRHAFVKWHAGAWVPADEPQGDVVNNSPRLERMPVFGRSLILLPAFAVILLLSAAGFAFAKPRATTAADAGSANVDQAIQLCLLGAAALFAVTIVIAVVRIAGSRRATDPVASRA